MNPLLKLTRNYRHKNLIHLVRLLLERGVDVNATGLDTFNALHNLCAYYEQRNLPDLIQLLKICHIDLETKTKYGQTALSLAAFERPTKMSWSHRGVVATLSKDVEFLKLVTNRLMEFLQLVSSKSKLESKEITRFTELVTDKNIEISSLIVQFSALPNLPDAYKIFGANALHTLIRHYRHDNLFDLAYILMAENVININDQDSFGRNALHFLFKYHQHDNLIEMAQFLIENKYIDVHAQTKTGWSPLHVLFRYYKQDNLMNNIKFLIGRKADLNVRNLNGWTPLHHLCRYYNHEHLYDVILLLKENNVNLRARTADGHSASYLLSTVWKSFISKNYVIELIQRNSGNGNLPTLLDYFLDWLMGTINDSLNDDE